VRKSTQRSNRSPQRNFPMTGKRLSLLAALLLIVLPGLASAQPVVTSGPACVTLAPSGGADDARLQAAALKAAALPARCLRLTAGTFHVSTVNAALLTLPAPGFDLGGAGMQQTRLVWADGLVLHNPPYYSFGVLIPAGADTVHIHDLALQFGAAPSGDGIWIGVEVRGGLHAQLDHLDISGAWGPLGTAGGAAIDTYQPPEVAGQFTWTTIRDVQIHDNPSASGITLGSNGNLITGVHIWNTGSNQHQHALYDTGGSERILGNVLGPNRGAGYNYHAHHSIQEIDAGGSVFADNVSIDPGFAHGIVDSLPRADGTQNAPNVTITGNTFRNSAGVQAAGLLLNEDVQAVVTGNVFQDTWGNSGAAISIHGPSTIVGNTLLAVGNTAPGGRGIVSNSPQGALIEGNTLDLRAGGPADGIRAEGTGDRVVGNTVVITGGGTGLVVGGGAPLVQGNRVTAGGYSLALSVTGSGAQIIGNTLTSDWYAAATGVTTATVQDNVWAGPWRLDAVSTGLRFAGNTGRLSYYGYAALPLTPDAGALRVYPPAPGGALGRGEIAAWHGAGVDRAGAGDRWAGVAVADGGQALSALYLVTAPGARLAGVCGAATLPVGHVGIVGAQAGCLTDGGTAPPAGSYARALGNGAVELWP
jgi:hypothetical protein